MLHLKENDNSETKDGVYNVVLFVSARRFSKLILFLFSLLFYYHYKSKCVFPLLMYLISFSHKYYDLWLSIKPFLQLNELEVFEKLRLTIIFVCRHTKVGVYMFT